MKGFEKIIKLSKKKKLRKVTPPYSPPDWFNKIKPSTGHGSGVIQQRAWRVVSEYVRKRDFKRHGGKCVSCDTVLARWEDGQAAHYIPYSVCHGVYKFDPANIFLSCATCNGNFSKKNDVGFRFGCEIVRRHGVNAIEILHLENEAHRGMKIETWHLVDMCERLLRL